MAVLCHDFNYICRLWWPQCRQLMASVVVRLSKLLHKEGKDKEIEYDWTGDITFQQLLLVLTADCCMLWSYFYGNCSQKQFLLSNRTPITEKRFRRPPRPL